MPRTTLFLVAALGATALSAQQLAFPGAEGFGRFATGGRGGEVYIVTNLNDSGPGSLRDAVTNRNPGVARTVVFEVSGTIQLSSTLRITQGNLTIAGQTAPGDGICLSRYPLNPSNASNVIIRFLRSRLGDTMLVEDDAFVCRYASNMIIDHCSFSWSVDECASAYDNTNFTMQWCVISESLRDSVHSKGAHGYGGIWGGLGASFHHNVMAHHDSRNPRFNGARTHGTANELVDMRNNVFYNWRGNSTYGGEPTDAGLPARHNLINNTYKNGPATGTGTIRYRILEPTANSAVTGFQYSLFHVTGNQTTASTTVTANNWSGGVQVASTANQALMRVDTPFAAAPVETQAAATAYDLVLTHAGCARPARDGIDTRILDEVRNGTFTYRGSKGNLAGIIDSQTDVGGWPVLASLPPPTDTDRDGMPDAWETARGLNPLNASDRNLLEPSGYTKLEVYLNSLAALAFPIPTIQSQPAAVAVHSGGNASFSIGFQSVAAATVQWRLNGVDLPGANAPALNLASVDGADAGLYSAVISSVYGTAESNVAALTLLDPTPTISQPPVGGTFILGSTAELTVAATGPSLAFQWFRVGGRSVQGATTSMLRIEGLEPLDAGGYYVVVSNEHGSATSGVAQVVVSSAGAGTLLSTSLASDTIHSPSGAPGGPPVNWFVMSSKNATGSSVGDDASTGVIVEQRPLRLTMAITGSGVVEGAARFANAPVPVPATGALRGRVVFTTTNVRGVGVGLFRSGGVNPFTTLNNAQLSNGSSTFATGGTQNWAGYRAYLDTPLTVPQIQARGAQSGTNNASQSLIVPGTSSSAVATNVGTSTTIPAITFADDGTYTLTFAISRADSTSFRFDTTVHSGSGTAGALISSSSATTTVSGTLPASIASEFDALGVGYRNRDDQSVSSLVVSSVVIEADGVANVYSNLYDAFMLGLGLSPAPANDANDSDGDGQADAVEFVLGSNPLALATLAQPAVQPAAGGGTEFRYHLRPGALETFLVSEEHSTDLQTWVPFTAADGRTRAVALLDAERDEVVLSHPTGPSRWFVRLRVQRIATP